MNEFMAIRVYSSMIYHTHFNHLEPELKENLSFIPPRVIKCPL